MRNFQDTFETRKPSFMSDYSILEKLLQKIFLI